MKTCKQFFARELMLFTSEDVRKVTRKDASMFGFCLLSYPTGHIKCQHIYAFTTDAYRAANWCDINLDTDIEIYAVVPAYNL